MRIAVNLIVDVARVAVKVRHVLIGRDLAISNVQAANVDVGVECESGAARNGRSSYGLHFGFGSVTEEAEVGGATLYGEVAFLGVESDTAAFKTYT